MGKEVVRKAKKVAKLVRKETTEAALFLLWLCTPPFSPKIFIDFTFVDDFILHNTRINLNNLYRKGFISKIRRKRNIFFKLKKNPKDIFWPQSQILKEEKYKTRWDGKWWILIYDIPEKIRYKRDAFRKYIKSLGFGQLQESCWISPYDFSPQLHDFCRKNKILRDIYLYKALFFSGKNISKAVDEIWGLRELKERYDYIIEKISSEIESIQTTDTALKSDMAGYTKLYTGFKETVILDPFLPHEFVRNWPRKKAVMLFEKLSHLLSQRIQHIL